MKEFLCMCCFLMSALSIRAQKTTIEEWTNWIQQRYGVHFIYSSELNIKRPYKGISLEDKSLKTSLNLLFVNSGIAWKKDGKNIILKILSAKKPAVVTCILTGYIKTQDGESVINASLFDLNTKRGVLTNEHGYYYMPLTEGKHTLRVSYVGCEDQLFHLDIHKDLFRNIVLK